MGHSLGAVAMICFTTTLVDKKRKTNKYVYITDKANNENNTKLRKLDVKNSSAEPALEPTLH